MRRASVGMAILLGLVVAPVSPALAQQQAGESPGPLPTSVDAVREGLSREPVLRLETPPIFRIEVTERRPRHWDPQSPFDFTFEPQAGGRWHDEFLAMTTPREVGMYSPMYSNADTAMAAATSLLFAGAMSAVTAAFKEWRGSRREGKARAAREEVDAALAAWEAANGRQR